MADNFPIQPVPIPRPTQPFQPPNPELGDLSNIYAQFAQIQQRKQQLQQESLDSFTRSVIAASELSLQRQKEAFVEKHTQNMMQYDQELKKQEAAKNKAQATPVEEEQLKAMLKTLGASPESLSMLDGVGPLAQPVAEMVLKGLAEEKSRQAALATRTVPLYDQQSGIQIGQETQNLLGIPLRRMLDPGADQKIQEYGSLREFLNNVDLMHGYYQQIQSQPLGAGFGRGALKNIEGKLGLNTPAGALDAIKDSTAGLATKFLERTPGSRLSLRMIDLVRKSRINPSMPSDVEGELVRAYKQIAEERLSVLRSRIVQEAPSQEQTNPITGINIDAVLKAAQDVKNAK